MTAKPITKRLRECVQCDAGLKTDADAGILRNVKVLGLDSVNRRQYLIESIRQAAPQYEGAKVNLNHPTAKNPNEPRTIGDRFGKLVNVHVVEGDGLRADLKFNPKHHAAAEVLWWAENEPDCLGLSHNAVGRGRTEADGTFIVEEILSVRSVDLVADPATTKGLYEAMDDSLEMPPVESDAGDWKSKAGELLGELVKADDATAHGIAKKLLALLAPVADEVPEDEGDEEEMDDEEEMPMDETARVLKAHGSDPSIRKLCEQLDRFKAREAAAARMGKARKLCEAARLPEALVTEVFLETVAGQPDEKGMKALIEDRRVLAGLRKPRSAAPGTNLPHPAINNVKDFANFIKRGS